ncbi:MAG: hypothetical protein HY217_10155 [Candidatus Rokubacteria bacterium]|nr:hypothetical protein [Candidatus Rokubacteria bacterium]
MEDQRVSGVIEIEEVPELSAAQREILLRRSWMTNDGLWFYQAFVNYGPDVANSWNTAVVREFGRLEMRRLLRGLGIRKVTSPAQYYRVFRLAVDLYVGDLFDYEDAFDGTTHQIRVKSCFAFTGVSKAGVAQVYHCGPFERVVGWFGALRLPVKISPEVGLCQMAHCGECRYTLSVEFPNDAEPAAWSA